MTRGRSVVDAGASMGGALAQAVRGERRGQAGSGDPRGVGRCLFPRHELAQRNGLGLGQRPHARWLGERDGQDERDHSRGNKREARGGQKKLVGIYISLARDLERMVTLAPPAEKKALSKGVSRSQALKRARMRWRQWEAEQRAAA